MRALLVTALALAAGVSHRPDPGDAPPLELTLELGGRRYTAAEGSAFQVEVGGRRVEAKVTVEPTRRFAAAGVTFRFPRGMGFAYDDSAGVPMWTLEGADCSLFVTEIASADAEGALLQQMRDTVGFLDIEDPEFETWWLSTSGTERKGLKGRFYFDALESDIELHGFAVRRGDKTVTVMLQDFPDDGEHDDEGPELLQMLSETFEVK